MAEITIVTALFAGARYGIPHSQHIYDATWVDKLYNMCNRHITLPFTMVCLVDQEYPIQAPVRQVMLEAEADIAGGWSLLIEMYRPDLASGDRLTIGLDQIICSNIDCYLQMDVDFAMVSDPFSHEPWVSQCPQYKDEVCNAMTWCNSESAKLIWDTWINNKEWVYENCILDPWDTVSEMVLLRKIFNTNGDVPRMDFIHSGIYSYKCHILIQPELVLMDTPKVIYFHGEPKPHELKDNAINEKVLSYWM